jgi:hypothetical protein
VIGNSSESVLSSNVVVEINGSTGGGFKLGASDLSISNSYAKDCDTYGFELSADKINVLGCVADNPGAQGFYLNTVDECRLVGCLASSPGTRGFDAASGKGFVPNQFDTCHAISVTEGFDLGGWAQMSNCSVFAPSGDAIHSQDDAQVDINNCVVDGATGALQAGINIGLNNQFTITGGRIIVDTGSPASVGLSIGNGSRGNVVGLYIKGDTGMSGAALAIGTTNTIVNISACHINGWGLRGIDFGAAGKATVSGCTVEGGSSGECVLMDGPGTLIGCQLYPASGENAVLCTSTTGQPIVDGNRIIGGDTDEDHIEVTGSSGATIIGNVTDTQGDIELTNRDCIVLGNRGFDVDNPGGASEVAHNISTV